MLEVEVARAALGALLLVIVGLALLAGIDYLWEVPRLVREIGLFGLVAAALLLAAVWVVAAVRRSNRPQTALEIEERFPELGQSVRTAVQFGDRADDAADGVRTSLVEALEEQIDVETRPLPLETVIPVGRLKIVLAVAAALVIVLGILFVGDPEWNTAGHRTLLEEQPYTKLSITPGDTEVDEGQMVTIGIELTGRTSRKVTLFTRKTDDPDAEWREQELSSGDLTSPDPARLQYAVPFAKVKEPFTYRVAAGTLASDEYHVRVRHPLRLESVSVELIPPEYTRAEPTVTIDGNISALEGTTAVFRFVLDRTASTASVVLSDPRDSLTRKKNADDEEPPEVIPVKIDGTALTMQMEVTEDKVYSLLAEAADGMQLPETSFRIRARKDQPPQVLFDEPREALEVHTLAEVMLRIRVRDDFGLTSAGIVFQVNNEEEHTLLSRDFEAALAEAESAAADGKKPAPTTQAVLDRLLPLEHFDLKEQDSVTYYAFAEDNFPGGHRFETDLRFIDIRPFRRLYKLVDPPEGGTGMPGRPLAVLSELIARQRFALNQAMRLARRPENAPPSDAGTVDRIIEFEQKLAAATRETAEFLEARSVPGNDLLFQAEESMLAAVDSLTVGKYDTAVLQEKDALRYLIEGRRTINLELLKKPPKTQAEARAFDRMQTQKLRKPKNEEDAEQVAQRLRDLAGQEQFVYATLSGVKMDDPPRGSGGSDGAGKSKQPPDEPPDPKKSAAGNADQPQPGDAADDPQDPADAPSKTGASEKDPDAKGGNGEPDDKPGDKPGDKTGDKPGDKPGDKAAGDSNPEGPDRGQPTREEIVQKQADIVVEAADIQRVMEKMSGLSDLAKGRIEAALKTAQAGADALDRGDSKAAAQSAGKATEMFQELARNVEALAAAETARKVAMARDVSEELSQMERDFAGDVERQQASAKSGGKPQAKLENSKPGKNGKPADDEEKPKGSGNVGKESDDQSADAAPGAGKPEKTGEEGGGAARRTEKLAARADRIAEAGKTLEDILKAIARSNEPADKDAARQVQELLEPGKLGEAVKRLADQSPAIRAGMARETTAAARELADRFEVAAQKLEGLHRSIVAPRIAELLEIERQAVDLQEKLERLETPGQITNWHRDTDELLEQLEKMGFAEEPREELVEAMQGEGWEAERMTGRAWNWAVVRGLYAPPRAYHRSIRRVVTELQAVIQELILGDLGSEMDGAVPPQYERLVERYHQVLSTDK